MRAIYPGMVARLTDGTVVRVTDVLIDRAEHAPRYLVLNPWGYFGPHVLAPFSSVWRVDDSVHLVLTGSEVAGLPHFDHYGVSGLCSRAAWRYGADRRLTPRANPPVHAAS